MATGRRPTAAMWSIRQPSVLDHLLDSYRAPTPEKRERGRDLFQTFVQQITSGEMSASHDIILTLSQRLAQIDELVSRQLNEILHHPAFQKLEASWRGLAYLVRNTRRAKAVKIRVLNASKRELLRDFGNYTDDGCRLRRGMTARLSTLGEEPFTLLLGDYEFGRHPEDVGLLADLGRLGERAQVPFLAAASAGIFGCESDWNVAEGLHLEKRMATVELTRWNDYRGRPYSIYTALVFPHILLRKPCERMGYRDLDTFVHIEDVEGFAGSKLLWGSGAWILAARLATAFENHSWCAELQTLPGGGTVGKLPWHRFTDDSVAGPASTAFTDGQAMTLQRLGFIPILRDETAHTVRFLHMPTVHRSEWPEDEQDDDEDRREREAERWASRLDYVIARCRIAHYVTSIIGQKRHLFAGVRACERYLNDWIRPYVGGAPDAPLRQAEFRVSEKAGPDSNSEVEVSILPNLRSGGLKTPIVFTISVSLREPLAREESEDDAEDLPVLQGAEPASGRVRFHENLRRANQFLAAGRSDVAAAILENLTDDIDRCRLEEWEGPEFALRTWKLLRQIYLDDPMLPRAGERSQELLRRICRLAPAAAAEQGRTPRESGL